MYLLQTHKARVDGLWSWHHGNLATPKMSLRVKAVLAVIGTHLLNQIPNKTSISGVMLNEYILLKSMERFPFTLDETSTINPTDIMTWQSFLDLPLPLMLSVIGDADTLLIQTVDGVRYGMFVKYRPALAKHAIHTFTPMESLEKKHGYKDKDIPSFRVYIR